MKKLIFLILSITLFLCGIDIDLPYHRGAITDIKHYQEKIYTTSRDGTLKIWQKNDLIHTFFEYGSINSVGVNDKYIVYTGALGKYSNEVKIIDKKSYKNIKTINIFRVINKIKYHKGIFYLLSNEGAIYTLDQNLKLNYIEYGKSKFEKMLYDIVFDDSYAYMVNWAGDIIKMDISSQKIVSVTNYKDRLQSISIQDNYLAVCGYSRSVYILDKNLNLKNQLYTPDKLIKCKFQNNYLVATPINGNKAYIYKDFKLHSTIDNIHFSLAVDIADDTILLSSGNELIATDFDGKVKYKITNHILKIRDIELLDGALRVASDDKNYYIDLRNLTLSSSFAISADNHKNYTNLYPRYEISSTYLKNDTLTIKQSNNKSCKIIRDASTGYRHNSVLQKDKLFFSSGDWGVFDIYNDKCYKVTSFITNLANIYGFDIGDDILASFDDMGTISLYYIKDLDRLGVRAFLHIVIFDNGQFLLYDDNFYYASMPYLKIKNLTYNKRYIQNIIHSKTYIPTIDLAKKTNHINFSIQSIKKCGSYICLSDFANTLAIYDINKSSIISTKFLDKQSYAMSCDDNSTLYIGGDNLVYKLHLDKDLSIYTKKIEGRVYSITQDKNNLYLLAQKDTFKKYTLDKELNIKKKNRFKSQIKKIDRYKNIVALYNDTTKKLVVFDSNRVKILFSKKLKEHKIQALNDRYILYDNKVFDFLNNKEITTLKPHIYKAYIHNESLYYTTSQGLYKIDLKTLKTDKIKLDKYIDDIDITKDKLYILSSNTIYIYDKNLTKQSSLTFRQNHIQNLQQHNDTILYTKKDSVFVYKDKKLIYKTTLKNLKDITLSDEYLIYSSYDKEFNTHLNIYSMKDNKLLFSTKGEFYQFVVAKDTLYLDSDDNKLYSISLKDFGKKLVIPKLPKYYKLLSIDNQLFIDNNYQLYTIKDSKLKLLYDDIDTYYKKEHRYMKMVANTNTIELNNAKESRYITSPKISNLLITDDYFVGSYQNYLFVWDMNFHLKKIRFAYTGYASSIVVVDKNTLWVQTSLDEILKIDLDSLKLSVSSDS
jgi:hypothetical protein